MHQKRREWEKKQKKFKNVANFNVPVLFASSEGLYLRLIDDEFGPGTEQNNDIENAVSQISILFFPNCSFFHGQNICPNLFLSTNFITKIPLIIIEEQKKCLKV